MISTFFRGKLGSFFLGGSFYPSNNLDRTLGVPTHQSNLSCNLHLNVPQKCHTCSPTLQFLFIFADRSTKFAHFLFLLLIAPFPFFRRKLFIDNHDVLNGLGSKDCKMY